MDILRDQPRLRCAVRDGLVVRLTRHDDPAEIARLGLAARFFGARYDFALAAEPTRTGDGRAG